MKNRSLLLMLSLASLFFFFLGSSVQAVPPIGEDTGIKYSFELHESGKYNGTEFYHKDHGKVYWGGDYYLNKISHARQNAIDIPLKNGLLEAMVSNLTNEGFSVSSQSVHTSGNLTMAFQPTSTTNVLSFQMSGLNAQAHMKAKKWSVISGWVHFYLTNFTVTGTYNYYNGVITVNSINAPNRIEADFNLNIPFIGQLLDPLLDSFVDKSLGGEVFSSDLLQLVNGGNSVSVAVGGIEDFIPLGKFFYNGVDYGAVLLDQLSKNSVINDSFSVTVGGIVIHQQRFQVTVGNASYTRWSSGRKEYCTIGPADPDCEFGF